MSFRARPSPYRSYVANTRMHIDEDDLPLYSEETASMLPYPTSQASGSLASNSSRQGSLVSNSSRAGSLESYLSHPGSLPSPNSRAASYNSSQSRPGSAAYSYSKTRSGSEAHSGSQSRSGSEARSGSQSRSGSAAHLSPMAHLSPTARAYHSSLQSSLSPSAHSLSNHRFNRFSESPIRANSFTPVNFGDDSSFYDTHIASGEAHRSTSPDVYSSESHMFMSPDVDSHVPQSPIHHSVYNDPIHHNVYNDSIHHSIYDDPIHHSVYDDAIYHEIDMLQGTLEWNAKLLNKHMSADPNDPVVIRLEKKQQKLQDHIEDLQSSLGINNVKRHKVSSR